MKVQLLIHYEPAETKRVWWAESPEVPGLSASADSLADVQALAKQAIVEILSEQDEPPDSIEIEARLVGTDNPNYTDVIVTGHDGGAEQAQGNPSDPIASVA